MDSSTNPVATDPAAMDPAAMDPAAMDPAAMDPAGMDPAAMDPAAATMSAPLLLSPSTRCALETFPLDLVAADSTTKELYLFLVDCSRGTRSLLRPLLQQLGCLEEFILRASPAGDNQFACLCYSEWVSFASTTPSTSPGVVGAANLVLLFESLEVLLGRIRKPVECLHIVFMTGALDMTHIDPSSLHSALAGVVTTRVASVCASSRFLTMGVGVSFPCAVVLNLLRPVFTSRVVDGVPVPAVLPVPCLRVLGSAFGMLTEYLLAPSLSGAVDFVRACDAYCEGILYLSPARFAILGYEVLTDTITAMSHVLLLLRGIHTRLCFVPGHPHDLESMLVHSYVTSLGECRWLVEDLNERRRRLESSGRVRQGLVPRVSSDMTRVSARYHPLRLGPLRSAILGLLSKFDAPGVAGLDDVYEDIHFQTYGSVLTDAKNGNASVDVAMVSVDAVAAVRNAYALAKLLPIPVRTLELMPRGEGVAFCPWHLRVKELPTVLKFVSVSDFFHRPISALQSGGRECVNSFIPLPCSGGSSPVIHTLATVAAIGDPELYHPDALGALVAGVVCRITSAPEALFGSTSSGGASYFREELDRALEVFRLGYAGDVHARIREYMEGVVDDGCFRTCLVSAGAGLDARFTCPSVYKFVLGVALGLPRLSLSQLRMRFKALMLEYIGRHKRSLPPLLSQVKCGGFEVMCGEVLEQYASEDSLRREPFLERGLAKFNTRVEAFLSESVRLEDVVSPPRVCLLGAQWGGLDLDMTSARHIFSNLYAYGRGADWNRSATGAASDVHAYLALTEGELARLVRTCIEHRGSHQRSLAPDWDGEESLTHAHPVALAAFEAWKVDMMAMGASIYSTRYRAVSFRLHSEVAYHVPYEYALTLQLLWGVDVEEALRIGVSGLSMSRCMCPSCPFFLVDLDAPDVRMFEVRSSRGRRRHGKQWRRAGSLPEVVAEAGSADWNQSATRPRQGGGLRRIGRNLAEHLRFSHAVPGLHRTVALVDPSAMLGEDAGVHVLSERLTPTWRMGPGYDPTVSGVYTGRYLRSQGTMASSLGLTHIDRCIAYHLRSATSLRLGLPKGASMDFLREAVQTVRNLEDRWPFDRFVGDVLRAIGA